MCRRFNSVPSHQPTLDFEHYLKSGPWPCFLCVATFEGNRPTIERRTLGDVMRELIDMRASDPQGSDSWIPQGPEGIEGNVNFA